MLDYWIMYVCESITEFTIVYYERIAVGFVEVDCSLLNNLKFKTCISNLTIQPMCIKFQSMVPLRCNIT